MKNRVYIEFDEHGRITKVDCDARHLLAVRIFIQQLSEKPEIKKSSGLYFVVDDITYTARRTPATVEFDTHEDILDSD